MVIFLILYFLLYGISFISIPYVVFVYVLSGDEYTLVSNPIYPLLWIIALLYLTSYFWISLRNIYFCFVESNTKIDLWSTIRKLNTIMVSSLYNSIAVTVAGFICYIVGITVIDYVPKVREIFMAFVQIPYVEYFLKGIMLAVGVAVADFISYWCMELPGC